LIVVIAILAGWLWWRRTPAIASGACRGCNVLLVTIDTLRLDRVGAFGGRPGLTPHLDQLASEGFRLTRAYSAAPLTLPSHASILTAVSPPVHGVRANGLFRLGPHLPTLATVLKSTGYRTGAFVGAFVLDARFGLNRGFDVYDDRYGEKPTGDPAEGAERRAADVIKPTTAWIINPPSNQQSNPPSNPQSATRNPPWFVWVHLYDPHEPYRAPEPYASQHEPYDAEVAYTDAMVGTLLSDLRAAGQLERTLVIVAADHGESLGEHGEPTHGVFVYDVTMRVPWIVWAGGRVPSGASDALVRLVDLAPTALDLLGVAAPAQFEGRSVLPAVKTGRDEAGSAYVEAMDANLTRNWAPLTGLATRAFKLIDLPIPELYDLRSDPHETTNLFARDAERARALGSLHRATTAAFLSRGSAAEKAVLSADARQRLQALGYIAMSVDPSTRVYTDVDDPKMLMGAASDLDRALGAFRAGARAEAIRTVREIIGRHPGFATAHGIFASMQRDAGDLGGAIATLEELSRRGIANQSVMLVLANYLQEAGSLERSAAVLQAVIASHPDYAEAYNSLGVVYSRQRQHAPAQAAFAKVLELDPTSATAYENLGVDDIGSGDLNAAVTALTHALELDPRLPGAHNALATAYLRQHRSADAIEHWQTAVRLDPHQYDALYNLGTVLYEAGRLDEARPYLRRFVEEAPPGRYRQDILRIRKMLIP
jgi:arylsulfatase A-like enzyme/Tfp pilus assembly protein PilF